MLVFYNVYFRSHYYFRSYCFVKRKTRICAIGSGIRRSDLNHPRKSPVRSAGDP